MFGGNFAPAGWALCGGQLISIADNDALFSLLGTTYGGDGQNTFGLPDLRGRIPINSASNYALGQLGGVENVTLITNQLPTHTHPAGAQSGSGGSSVPASNTVAWAQASGNSHYSTNAATGVMNAGTIGITGGSQPHDNMLPFQCVNYIIALLGIYPPRS